MALKFFTNQDRTYILDGGLGSTLQDIGCKVDSDPLWSARLLLKSPRNIILVHEEFIRSGVDIITTASYQASVEGFKTHLKLEPSASEALMSNSVMLAKRATEITSRQIFTAGSIGPYGACQSDGSEYTGDHVDQMTEEELMMWHRPRVRSMYKGGCELFAVETQPSVKEALAILKVIKEFERARAWVSFSCKDATHTNGGDNLVNAVIQCYKEAPDRLEAVGVNCCTPQIITPILESLLESENIPPPTQLPRIVYPNSGELWVSGTGWMTSSSGEQADVTDWDVLKWKSLGARVIGGCCRVGPRNIKHIAKRLAKL